MTSAPETKNHGKLDEIAVATRRQQEASNPLSPIWVSASAGTGKTKVLSDRYLRLLLPTQNPDGSFNRGASPKKILCITFTKAAAAEMENRVRKRLAEWAVMDDDELVNNITGLTGTAPAEYQIHEARRLFARTIDASGGLQIMTIHSFCQSVLARFPIEAGISPNFTVLENSEEYLETAKKNIIGRWLKDEQKNATIKELLSRFGIHTLNEIIQSMIGKRIRLSYALEHHGSIDGLMSALRTEFELDHGTTSDSILHDFKNATPTADIKAIIDIIQTYGTPKEQADKIPALAQWIAEDKPDFTEYRNVFLTKSDNDIRKTLLTKKPSDAAPDLAQAMFNEAERIQQTCTKIMAVEIIEQTTLCLELYCAIEKEFSDLKSRQSALDFDDQIAMTAKLLSDEATCGWVMYKLDGGIDHILVDEAQDTNPDQWRIIKALTMEMTSGKTRYDDAEDAAKNPRTLFVVGDEKQSIYSFQNADPKEFAKMRDFFHERFAQCNLPLQEVAMNISFRSVPAVLETVNAVFKNDLARQGLTQRESDDIIHYASRKEQSGSVTLWPYVLQETTKKGSKQFRLPIEPIPSENAVASLAKTIAHTVKDWIDSKRIIPARGRPITAGDILVLVTTRTHFVIPFVKALKELSVPVSGIDRVILREELCIQDMLALLAFTLLPEDDLTLAALLKSPLFNCDEDLLFSLCINRKDNSLWNVIKTREDCADCTAYLEYLQRIRKKATTLSPFELLTHILESPCPADSISGKRAFLKRMGQPVKEPLTMLLIEALTFEQNHSPSIQEFHHWMISSDSQVKPEMDAEGFTAVRIMTVHGSKGLQAPIVIMPDTFKYNNDGQKEHAQFDWLTQELPFYSTGRTNKHATVQSVITEKKSLALEEYRRLLYVAMTRAEDELYVTGWQKMKASGEGSALPESWYNLIKQGIDTIGQTTPLPNDAWHELPLSADSATVFTMTGEKQHKEKAIVPNDNTIPSDEQNDWIYSPVTMQDETPTKPLRPSRPDDDDDTAGASPLMLQTNPDIFKMGNITHHLLQVLPDIPADKREKTARAYLANPAHDISAKRQEEAWQEINTILHHPTFAPLFTPQSRAEISITGLLEGQYVVSGQVDRLVETDDTVMIVDYKTNRPPPQDESGIPDLYAQQLAGYRGVLQNVYPNKTIRCALLWTFTQCLMEVPTNRLDAAYSDLLKKKRG